MAGVEVALLVFVFSTAIGMAAVSGVCRRVRGPKPEIPIQLVLLTPALGFSVTVMPALWLNWSGLPVKTFSLPLCVMLATASCLAIFFIRPRLPWRSLTPFLVILAGSFLLVGRPLFEFGLNWLSFSNDDMANYCLEAQRQINHGFFSIPDSFSWNTTRDASLYYWMTYAVFNSRDGVDTLLALFASLFRITTFQAFMPVLIPMHLMLVCSTAALVYQNAAKRLAAIFVAIAISASALNGLGTEYQLFSQVCGVGLLAGALALVPRLILFKAWSDCVLPTILMAGLAIIYPEITPFFVLTAGIYVAAALLRRTVAPRRFFWGLGITVAALAVLLNAYLRTYAFAVITQSLNGTHGSVEGKGGTLFYYYLIPSGPATFFGLLSLDTRADAPGISLFVALGFALGLCYLAALLAQLRKFEPVAVMSLVMSIFAGLLFVRTADFGLFKLAMYQQPFMLGVFALCAAELYQWLTKEPPRVAFLRLLKGRGHPIRSGLSVALLIVFCLFLASNMSIQQYYVERSRGATGNASFVEIQNASSDPILATLGEMKRQLNPSNIVVADTWNVVLAKIESGYLAGHMLYFPSDDFFLTRYDPGVFLEGALGIPSLKRAAARLYEGRRKHLGSPQFPFTTPGGSRKVDTFYFDKNFTIIRQNQARAVLLTQTAQQTTLNRWSADERIANDQITIQPFDAVKDHIVFVASKLGQSYFTRTRQATLYQLEPDFFYGGQTMAGLGRYALFEVLNPAARIRFEMTLTDTLQGNGKDLLPPAILFGGKPVQLGLTGRGSARAISPVVEPRKISGEKFFLLDMGVSGTQFKEHRSGLMNLYGREIVLDPRLLTCFVRDISVISDAQFKNAIPPRALRNFPGELLNKNIFYSGYYEDGWVSENSWVRLFAGPADSELRVRGVVPMIDRANFRENVIVTVDEKPVYRAALPVGYFRFAIPLPGLPAGTHAVGMVYSGTQQLPNGDGRPVSAHISFVGFAH